MTLRGLSFSQFAGVFGALCFVLLLIYLLRYRRRGKIISSNLIWKKVVGAKRSIWSEIAAFLLHLLVLGLIAFALTDPAPEKAGIHRRFVAVVVDTSLSMSATTGETTRLDIAAKKAWDLVDSLREVDRAMIIPAGPQPRAVTGFTNSKDDLKGALETMKPKGRAPKINEAVQNAMNAFALEKLGADDTQHLFVFTDRPGDVVLPTLPGVDAKVVGVGAPEQNLAIAAFDVRKPFNLTGGHELMVRVVNFGSTPCTARLLVYTKAATVGTVSVMLEPGEEKTSHYFLPFGVQGKVNALLQDIVFESGVDALLEDNAAFAFIPTQKKFPALLVTKGNLFLKKALSINPQVTLSIMDPGSYSKGASSGYAMVIFDNFTPPELPSANAVYINPAGAPFSPGDEVKQPQMTGWNDTHPLLKYITLTELNIESATPFEIQKGDVVLAESFDRALILEKTAGKKKVVGFAFNLNKSDLPLRTAFPILFHNAVTWFAGTDDVEQRTGHQVGEPARLPITGDPKTVDLTTPRGKKIALYPREGAATFVPEEIGFYSYFDGKDEKTFAVSLTDPEESDLSGALDDPLPPFTAIAGQADREVFWPYLILLAFLLIVADFWLYNNGKLP